MTASTKEHDRAFIGENRTAVVSLMELPTTTLPKRSEGVLNASITITTSKAQLLQLVPIFLGADPIRFEMTLAMSVAVDVRFFQRRWKVSQAFLKDCGMAMQGIAALALGQPGGKMSSLVCGSSFDGLAIPSVDDLSPVSEGMSFAAEDIDTGAVEQGTAAKNIGLGSAIAWGYGLFLALGGGACCCVLPSLRHARMGGAAGEAAEGPGPGGGAGAAKSGGAAEQSFHLNV